MLGNCELQESSRDHTFLNYQYLTSTFAFVLKQRGIGQPIGHRSEKKHLPDEKIYFYLLQTNFTQLGALN